MKKKLFFIAVTALLLLNFNLIQAQNPRQIFDFEALSLPDTGFWNGADTSQYNYFFGDDFISFSNSYTDYGSYDIWNDFAFSSWTDTVTEGYGNQWSVFVGKAHSDSIFGLCYVSTDWTNNYTTIPVEMNFSRAVIPNYFYISNSTYTALTIKNGSNYNQPFSTVNQDYYKIIITAFNNNDELGTIDVILADYRTKDSMIVDSWKKVDLTSFGTVTKLTFDAFTTDVGNYGPNTPLYFCLDDFVYSLPETSIYEKNQNIISVYPNPTSNYLNINSYVESLEIIDLTGRIVRKMEINEQNPEIYISDLKANTYFLRIKTNNGIQNGKFIKI